MGNGNAAKVSIILAIIVSIVVLAAIAYVAFEDSRPTIRKWIASSIKILGAVGSGFVAGAKSLLLEFDDDAVDAMNRKH